MPTIASIYLGSMNYHCQLRLCLKLPWFRVWSGVLAAVLVLLVAVPQLFAQTNWGNALFLDGKDDYVTVPSGTWFRGDFTIEAWVYGKDYNYHFWSRVIDFGNGPDAENVVLALSSMTDNLPVLHVVRNGSGSSSLTSPERLPVFRWVHLAATLKGTTGTLHIDGIPVTSKTLLVPKAVNRTKNYIGKSNWDVDGYPNVVFDDLRIWSVARTVEQIREGMGHPMTGKEPNLVGYWNFDEPGGTLAFDGTANHMDGTLMNGAGRTNSTLPLFVNTRTDLPALGDGSSGCWGDYDNDGDLDILIMGMDSPNLPSTKVLQNNGNGTFTDINAGFTGGYYASPGWGDYNNDGFLDALVSGYDPYGGLMRFAQVWRNNGNHSFTHLQAGLPGTYVTTAWGDFDNDGKLDILLPGGTEPAAVWHNNGDGTFTQLQAGLPKISGTALPVDYDNDGHLDILLNGYVAGNPVVPLYATELWRNNGDGTFSDTHAGLTGLYGGSVASGDYDNDGRLDIMVAGHNTKSLYCTELWRNTESGFVKVDTAISPLYEGQASWGDYDNDGRLDILLTGLAKSSAAVEIWRNTGSSFEKSELIYLTQGSVAWGDYDNDGRLDILLTGNGDSNYRTSQIWRNVCPNINTPPSAPSGLNAVISGNGATLSWNPAADAQTTAASLSYNIRIGTAPGRADVLSPQSDLFTGRRRVQKMGNAQLGLTALIAQLPEGEYYWSVQAVDGAFAGSPFAPEHRFAIHRPAVSSATVSGIRPNSATLHGSINPREQTTFAWFEYGLTTKYGKKTPPINMGSGNIAVDVTNTITDLLPWMTYHFRLVGSNGVARVDGPDNTVTLPGPSATAPAMSSLSNITVPQGVSTTVEFTVSDADTPSDQLVIQTHCNNPVLVPVVAVTGSGATRKLILAPDPNQSGSAAVTVRISDDSSTVMRTFAVTVTPNQDLPTASSIVLTNAHIVSEEVWQFQIAGPRNGSGSYTVQYRLDLSPTNTWIDATNVTPLGNGVFQVDHNLPQTGSGFYRIRGILLLTAGLGSIESSVEEGTSCDGPVILFNSPYSGTVRYTWTGWGGTTNGSITVNGTTAVIPLPVPDNTGVDQVRSFTLRLEPGSDYQLADNVEGRITIGDNDADWQGTLILPNGVDGITMASLTNKLNGGYESVPLAQNENSIVGFTLRVQQSNGGLVGEFLSDGFGFLPANILVQLTSTANKFSAVATSITMPALADCPLFATPHQLDLRLDAANVSGQTNISARRISGTVTWVSKVPRQPHLDVAITGSFLLLKPPGIPSTHEVRLQPLVP